MVIPKILKLALKMFNRRWFISPKKGFVMKKFVRKTQNLMTKINFCHGSCHEPRVVVNNVMTKLFVARRRDKNLSWHCHDKSSNTQTDNDISTVRTSASQKK